MWKNDERRTSYKGYTGVFDLDHETGSWHGHVIDIRDVITFEGNTPDEAVHEFHESVDVYLEFCEKRNVNPEKPEKAAP